MSRQQPRVPLPALFDNPALARVINVDDAEAAAIAFGPLKVVQQGPREIPLDRDAQEERDGQRLQMLAQILTTLRIQHMFTAIPFVVVGRPVLSDQDGRRTVLLLHAQEEVEKSL